MHAVRNCVGPIVVITQRGSHPTIAEKILEAQVVVSPHHDSDHKRVMQVSLVLHRVETLEVQLSNSMMSCWSYMKNIARTPFFVFGALGHEQLQNHGRITFPGDPSHRSCSQGPPLRVLDVLMKSGNENCNIKPCRPQLEAELNIGTVWAQTMEKDTLLTQLAQLPHVGIIRTKNCKFLVRCLPDQVAAIRQAVAKEDHRYASMPNLVVTRKWKISNVPSSLCANLLSEALRLCHHWEQIPLGSPHSKGKSMTWSPLVGSSDPPPQSQLLVQDHICIITEVGARQAQPSATIQVTTVTPGAKPVPFQGPDVLAQVNEGMRQTEQLLTDHIDAQLSAKVVDMVDSKLQQVQKLQEKVTQMDATIQALHASSSSSSTRIQAIEATTAQTSSRLEAFVEHVDKVNTGTQGEITKLTTALNDFATQQRSQWAVIDASLDEKMERMGLMLMSKMTTRKRAPEDEDPDAMAH
eukprot:276260-Amphidinium_carterae.1